MGAQGLVAAVFFVVFVIMTGLVMISLFIGVVTTSMSDATAEIAGEAKQERERKAKARAASSAAREKSSRITRAESIDSGGVGSSSPANYIKQCWETVWHTATTWFDVPVIEYRSAVPTDSCYVRLSLRMKSVVETRWFNHSILAVIISAGLMAGVETMEVIDEELLWVCEGVITAIFALECAMKFVAEGVRPLDYLRRRMNLFDLGIVVICAVALKVGDEDSGSGTASSTVATLRLLRLLRLLKLLDAVPQLKIIVGGLQRGLASISFIFLLLVLVFYVFGIFGLVLFQKNDPFHFQNLHTAFLSLFRAATFEVSSTESHCVHCVLYVLGSPRNTPVRLGGCTGLD